MPFLAQVNLFLHKQTVSNLHPLTNLVALPLNWCLLELLNQNDLHFIILPTVTDHKMWPYPIKSQGESVGTSQCPLHSKWSKHLYPYTFRKFQALLCPACGKKHDCEGKISLTVCVKTGRHESPCCVEFNTSNNDASTGYSDISNCAFGVKFRNVFILKPISKPIS